ATVWLHSAARRHGWRLERPLRYRSVAPECGSTDELPDDAASVWRRRPARNAARDDIDRGSGTGVAAAARDRRRSVRRPPPHLAPIAALAEISMTPGSLAEGPAFVFVDPRQSRTRTCSQTAMRPVELKPRASEPCERATRTERAGAAASERACGGVRGAKPPRMRTELSSRPQAHDSLPSSGDRTGDRRVPRACGTGAAGSQSAGPQYGSR